MAWSDATVTPVGSAETAEMLVATAVELCMTCIWQADIATAVRVTSEALARIPGADPDPAVAR